MAILSSQPPLVHTSQGRLVWVSQWSAGYQIAPAQHRYVPPVLQRVRSALVEDQPSGAPESWENIVNIVNFSKKNMKNRGEKMKSKSQWEWKNSREIICTKKLSVILGIKDFSTKIKGRFSFSHRDLSDLLVQEDRLLVRRYIHINHALPYGARQIPADTLKKMWTTKGCRKSKVKPSTPEELWKTPRNHFAWESIGSLSLSPEALDNHQRPCPGIVLMIGVLMQPSMRDIKTAWEMLRKMHRKMSFLFTLPFCLLWPPKKRLKPTIAESWTRLPHVLVSTSFLKKHLKSKTQK